MKTPTPETDALIDYLSQQFPATVGHLPLREKISKLERERDAAVSVLTQAKEWIDEAKVVLAKAADERDQLIKLADGLATSLGKYQARYHGAEHAAKAHAEAAISLTAYQDYKKGLK